MADLTIEDVRQQYPQYGDLSDGQLAQALHKKYYSDMPFDTFAGKIGYAAKTATSASEPLTFGNTLAGEAELAGSALGNIPHAAAHGAVDLYRRLTGGDTSAPDPRLVQAIQVPTGDAGRNLAQNVSGLLPDATPKVSDAELRAYAAPEDRGLSPDQLRDKYLQEAHKSLSQVLEESGTVLGDVTSGAGHVGQDVASLLPATQGSRATGALSDAAQGARDAVEAARTGRTMDVIQGARDAASPIARSPAEVAQAAGYTGLHTKSDLNAPGNKAITNTLISQDAGIVPGQTPSVAALENALKVGPGKVYAQAENSIPAQLSFKGPGGAELQDRLGNLPNTISDLPRSPDVEALQETMLSKPEFTRDTLFANIRQARQRAKVAWENDDPDKNALGDAYANLANAYEDFAGAQLEANPNAGVTLADWKAARTQFAKNYQAQGALRGEDFDPQVYARTAARNPHLLTGNGAIVGHIANGLPSSAPIGMADILPEAAGVTAGGAAAELLGNHLGIPGGSTVGGIAGHYAAAPLIRAKLQELLRRGNPELAEQTNTNPALSYFFNQGRMPTGWNRSPVTPQIAGLLPSPSMVNMGGGATTQNTLENLGLTPDVQAAGVQHPAAARLEQLREQLSQPPERPAAPVDFQGPQKWGDFSVAPQPQFTQTPSGVPFADVLEQGGTQGKPIAGIKSGYRPAPQAPKGPNMRTPEGAPTLTDTFPTGPSDAQIAFRNQQAAARLRKVAGDLTVQGPGSSSGSPLDRLRDALTRQERGYADGGTVRNSSSPGSPGVGGAVQDALAALRDYFVTRPRRELQAERDQFENGVINNPPPAPPGAPTNYADGGPAPDTPLHPKQSLVDALARLATVPSAGADPAAQAAYLNRARVQVGDQTASLMRLRAILNAAQAPQSPPAAPATQGGG